MDALILLAGRGTRLKELTKGRPKCFLKINGKKIIDYQIESLAKNNIDKITIILGYEAKIIKNYLQKKYKDINIVFKQNQEFETSNTILSFIMGLDEIKNEFICLNGDVVFDEDIIKNLKMSEGSNLIISKHPLNEEDVKVKINKNFEIIEIGKDIPISSSWGEFIGIAKFNIDLVKQKEDLKSFARKNKKEYFEYLINILILRKFKFKTLYFPKLKCCEIDYPEDYMKCKKLFEK